MAFAAKSDNVYIIQLPLQIILAAKSLCRKTFKEVFTIKATGTLRSIDDLGRIVILEEIRTICVSERASVADDIASEGKILLCPVGIDQKIGAEIVHIDEESKITVRIRNGSKRSKKAIFPDISMLSGISDRYRAVEEMPVFKMWSNATEADKKQNIIKTGRNYDAKDRSPAFGLV